MNKRQTPPYDIMLTADRFEAFGITYMVRSAACGCCFDEMYQFRILKGHTLLESLEKHRIEMGGVEYYDCWHSLVVGAPMRNN